MQNIDPGHSGSLEDVYEPEVDSSFRPENVELVREPPGSQFSCRKGAHPVSAEVLIDPKKYTLTQSSQLNVFNDSLHIIETFNYEDFCVAFTKEEREPVSGGIQHDTEPLRTTYTVCVGEVAEADLVDDTVYPVAIFISDFFVLVTLLTYLLMSEYRNNMFGRITIGFLVNVFFSYLFIGIHYSLDIEVKI